MPVAKKALQSASVRDACSLQIRVYDGTRNPFPAASSVLCRLIDANQKQVFVGEKKTAAAFCSFPFHGNFMHNYTAIVFSDDYKQAGYTPVKLSPSTCTTVDLMLIPKNGRFNFSSASWDWVKETCRFWPMESGTLLDKRATRISWRIRQRNSLLY